MAQVPLFESLHGQIGEGSKLFKRPTYGLCLKIILMQAGGKFMFLTIWKWVFQLCCALRFLPEDEFHPCLLPHCPIPTSHPKLHVALCSFHSFSLLSFKNIA